MNRKRLDIFRAALVDRRTYIHKRAVKVSLVYLQQKRWCECETGIEVPDKKFRSELDAARKANGGVLRPRGERRVLFWIRDFESAVVVDFDVAIRRDAQQSAKTAIDRIAEDAINEYRASHDVHTGLKNRVAFDQSLLTSIDLLRNFSEAKPVTVASSSEIRESVRPSVVLASLDIDHFKAINDRFGHGYGDIVLAAIAARLELAAMEVERDAESKFSVQVFRLGGEEFQVLFTGALTEREGLLYVERICARIRDESLPSSSEFERISKADFYDGTQLPHDSDRRVTVSIGVSATIWVGEKSVDVAKKLKRQSDLALYSAKISGRDRVRYFAEILESGGRVSVIDRINGLVAIDIGKEVGVKKGQEFFVYPPNYDGNTPFFLGEGRSRKRVGMYPRFRAGRISAIDVQGEFAFCKILMKEDGVSEIQEGSTLQAIPLGSIMHLVDAADGGGKFLDSDAFRREVSSRAGEEKIVVIAVSLTDIERVSEDRGMDFANDCIGRIGRYVLSALKGRGKFAQAALGAFVAVVRLNDGETGYGIAESLRNGLGAQLDSVSFGVGWSEDDSSVKWTDIGGLVDAALLSSIEASIGGEVGRFSPTLWANSLARSRDSAEYGRMSADYDLFSGLGVSSPYADTQMAFLNLFGPDKNLELGERFLRQAAAAPDSIDIIVANLGCFLIAQGQSDEGFPLVRDLDVPENYTASVMFGALDALPKEDFEEYVRARPNKARSVLSGKPVWLRNSQIQQVRDALTKTGVIA